MEMLHRHFFQRDASCIPTMMENILIGTIIVLVATSKTLSTFVKIVMVIISVLKFHFFIIVRFQRFILKLSKILRGKFVFYMSRMPFCVGVLAYT